MHAFISPIIARIDSFSPAQWHRSHQIAGVILVGSIMLPAWLHIITLTSYALLIYFSFKPLCLGVIQSVIDARPKPRQPAAHSAPVDKYHGSANRVHKFAGDGRIGRPGRRGR
jgi:hypothetical protein